MEPTATAEAQRPAPRPGLAARLAARLPEIVIEAMFVLVAVLLAFLVEEWREDRELDRIADEARGAIVQEIEHNRDELLESRPSTLASIAALEAALAAPAGADPERWRGVGADFEIALLSTAAWRSAQSMEAGRRMDYDWMLAVARAHELQALYAQAQDRALEAELDFRAAFDDAARTLAARKLLSRIRSLSGFSESLEDDYVDVLAAARDPGAIPATHH